MKKTLHLAAIMLLQSGGSYAQETLFNTQAYSSDQRRELSQVLAEVEKAYYVNFYYNANELSGKYVSREFSAGSYKNVNQVLSDLLYNNKLDYEKVSDNYYFIFPQKEDKESAAQAGNRSFTTLARGLQSPAEAKPSLIRKHHTARQERVITGRVSDVADNFPLPGVSVRVKEGTAGASTDLEGNYSIQVNDEAVTLVFSYVGYITREVSIGDQSTINVQLEPDVQSLNQVVVVGYGTQKKANLTGAVSQIDSEVLEDRPINNVGQALQGAIPNLNVNFGDGRPGGNAKINIRGYTSINGGDPLVMIDGVPGDINLLNPLDVASITVLKDASSAAIYGARAAYGVILITTKQGQEGKLQVVYSNNFSIATPTTSHEFMTDGYETGRLIDEAFRITTGNDYTGYTDEDYAELKKRQTDHSLPDVTIQNRNGTDQYVWYGSTDWWDYFFREQMPSMNHSIQFSGGSEKINFLVSGRFNQQLGMMQLNQDKNNAYNLRAKIEAKLTPWLTLGNNLQFAASTYNYPGSGSRGGINTSFVYLGVHALPSYVPVNPDGSFTFRSQLNNYGIADGRNLELQYGKAKSQEQEYDLTNTINLTLQPVPSVSIVGSYSYNLHPYSSFHRSTVSPWSIIPGEINYNGNDYYTESTNTDQYHVINAYATYTETFGRHSLKIMGGYNQELKKYHNLNGRANNLLSEDLNALNLGTSDQQVGSNSVEWALLGFFGRINYNYADKYLLEINGRYDGTSHFPSGSRFGFFPSVSAGWRISEEPFFEPLKNTLSELKIRGSYGSLGNQSLSTNLRSRNYPYIPVMNTGLSSWLIDGQRAQYMNVGAPVSPELTWERTTSVNAGLDLGFLDNRLNASFDIYERKTLDMLIAGKTLPRVFGAASPRQNAANLETRGFELSLKWQSSVSLGNKPFSYNAGIVLSDSKSYITRFDNPEKLLGDPYEGGRIGQIWGYTVDGYFQSDEEAANYGVNQDYVNQTRLRSPGDASKLQAGDMKFIDLSGDGVINNGQNTLDDHGDLTVLGNNLPRYSYGITGGADWNGFDISFFFQGVGRQDWYPGSETYFYWGVYGRPYYSFIPADFREKIWTPENPDAYFPKLRGYSARDGRGALRMVNTKYMQNIAYIRLKNLTVGYTLPASLLQRWNIARIRIYFSGENIFTASPFDSDYVDPEQVSADPNGGRGDNNARNYPFMKQYSFGLGITF